MPSELLRALCFPSRDKAFGRVVDQAFEAGGITAPADLEDRLRPLFPEALVRARELDGEDGSTWYVYRDGRLLPPDSEPWWHEDGVARVRLALPDGAILMANEEIAVLTASTEESMLGVPYLEFVVPAAREAAASLFATCIALGKVETVVRILRRDGETIMLEVHAELIEGEIEIRFRPVSVVSATA